MAKSETHRKRVRHFNEPGHLHELTFSCYRRMPLLTNDLWRAMLSTAIDRATLKHQYALSAFVFMPEHLHLLVYPTVGGGHIDRLLKAIKRPFSYQIKQLLLESRSQLLDTLTIQQRPDVTTFRFWQEGPGYDRNMTEPATAMAAIDYIHLNPVRRGLVRQARDWKWSSAKAYEDSEQVPTSDMPLITPIPSTFWDTDS